MPLPKLPTRPAAILNFPSGETLTLDSQQTDESAARRPSGRKTVTDQPDPVQPELAGLAAGASPSAARTRKRSGQAVATGAGTDAAPASMTPAARQVSAPDARTADSASATAAPKRTASRKAGSATIESPSRPARKGTQTQKLFVLDTNVLLHDPSSLFRFEEHDVYLPMMTLEELDHKKKGMSEVARNEIGRAHV